MWIPSQRLKGYGRNRGTLETPAQPREVRRHGRHSVAPGCKFRDYRRWGRRAGSMNQNRDGSRQRRTPMKWMLTMLAAGTCAGAFTALAAPAPKVSIVDQLEKLGVKVDQVKYVGISHYHADHTGQVGSFPKATLLIGSREWDAITSPKPAEGVNFKPFENWAKGEGKVEALALDKDVFGDGSVIVLRTPGHTPGHQSLLVKLPQMGAVVIVGDAAHFRENYDSDGVPAFNFDRAQTVASRDRRKKIAANLKATVIIQHDARDVDKLPAFPASAK